MVEDKKFLMLPWPTGVIKFAFFGFLTTALMIAGFHSESAFALSDDSNKSTREARDAYNQAGGGYDQGALWINAVKTGSGVESDTITIQPSATTVTIYFHGAVICGGKDSLYYGNTVRAHTARHSSYPPDSSWDEPSITITGGGENNAGNIIYRGKRTSTGSWSTGWDDGNPITATLDVNKFKQGATHSKEGDYDVWKKTIYAYRCYGKSYNRLDGTCGGSPVQVTIRSPEIKEQTGTYTSTSAASVGSSAWGTNATYYLTSPNHQNISTTFNFKHTIKSSAPFSSTPEWQVSRNGTDLTGRRASTIAANGSSDVHKDPLKYNIDLGQKLQVCQTISHQKDVKRKYYLDDDGKAVEVSLEYTGWVSPSSSACAEARHPYNFVTNPTASINSNIVYAGETANLSGQVTLSHKNDADTPANYPTTITPDDTTVRLIQFTLTPEYNGDLNGGIGTDPCNFVRNKYGSNLIACANATDDQKGSIPADSTGVQLADTVTVPDAIVGTKLCTALAANPADSGTGYNSGLNRNWKISGATCRPISKKPNFQTWNGGVATEGSITTSVSRKTINATLGQATNPTIFGSWDEQLVIAGRGIKGFASGATLGYAAHAYNLALPGGHASTTTLQALSPLTISNTNNSAIGDSHISLASPVLDRLKARYTRLDTSSWSDHGGIKTSSTGLEYIELPDGANLGQVIKTALSSDQLGNDNTRIYFSTGTINITGDICYGSPCPGTATRLDSYTLAASSIAALPQVLIFANNINIAPDVTRIDAWLIADGTLNTCSGAAYGPALTANRCNKTLVINGPTFAGQLQLMRTAGALPGGGNATSNVLTRDLSNDGSITPAEIFNLRTDAYLWAYAQAQRFSEAVTTYTRELSPRL